MIDDVQAVVVFIARIVFVVFMIFVVYNVVLAFIMEVVKQVRDRSSPNLSNFQKEKLDFRQAGVNANCCSYCGRLFTEQEFCAYCQHDKLSHFGGISHAYSADCSCSYCKQKRGSPS